MLVLFHELQERLLLRVRALIRNGLITERGLARLTGVSQPHMHNVLKGVRILTPELADSVMRCLHLNVLDLIERREIDDWMDHGPTNTSGTRRVPLLRSPIGPGYRWTDDFDSERSLVLPAVQVAGISRPVIARAACDKDMSLLAGGARLLLLDCGNPRADALAIDSLYVVDRSEEALVRRACRVEDSIGFVSDWGQDTCVVPSASTLRGRVIRVWQDTADLS